MFRTGIGTIAGRSRSEQNMRRSLVPHRIAAADSFLLRPARSLISSGAVRRSSTFCAGCSRGLNEGVRLCGWRHTPGPTQYGSSGSIAPGTAGVLRSGIGLHQQVRRITAGLANGSKMGTLDPNYGPMQAYDDRVNSGRLRDDGHQRGTAIPRKVCTILLC
jgi:hypothetical protein